MYSVHHETLRSALTGKVYEFDDEESLARAIEQVQRDDAEFLAHRESEGQP